MAEQKVAWNSKQLVTEDTHFHFCVCCQLESRHDYAYVCAYDEYKTCGHVLVVTVKSSQQLQCVVLMTATTATSKAMSAADCRTCS